MSATTEMVIVYVIVASALLYVTRGWIMKLFFKKNATSEEACGACDSNGCASCKLHTIPDLKGV